MCAGDYVSLNVVRGFGDTAYDRYAGRAFDVHAVDYLMKPFHDARFAESLARAKVAVRASVCHRRSRVRVLRAGLSLRHRIRGRVPGSRVADVSRRKRPADHRHEGEQEE